MIDERIALRELLEKGSDATFLREMIGFAAHRLMELDAEGACGAGHGERSPERVNLDLLQFSGEALDQLVAILSN